MAKQIVTASANGELTINGKKHVPDKNFDHFVQGSVGAGDTVAKITHATGIDKMAKLYTRTTGKDCGCNKRQKDWNKKIDYNGKQTPVVKVLKAIDKIIKV